jgi:hypothetical protein
VCANADNHNAVILDLELEMNTASLARIVRAPVLAKPALPAAGHLIALLERLAAWADRQAQHHRVGSWTTLGIHRRP